MLPLPHHYSVQASGKAVGAVVVSSAGLPALATWPPPEFDGPPGHWSPETLFLAAVADCYVLSFRAAARAAGLDWEDLSVDAQGTLERIDGVTRFSLIKLLPVLTLGAGAQADAAGKVLEKAKKLCLITNSLSTPTELSPRVLAGE